MDPITLILSALALGASAGITSVATEAIKDAYTGLKEGLKALLGGPKGSVVVDEFEKNPEAWTAPLRAELEQREIAADSAVVAHAQILAKLLDADGAAEGRYQVIMPYAQGVQVGDKNRMKNEFTN